jgi:hypothetical protein
MTNWETSAGRGALLSGAGLQVFNGLAREAQYVVPIEGRCQMVRRWGREALGKTVSWILPVSRLLNI